MDRLGAVIDSPVVFGVATIFFVIVTHFCNVLGDDMLRLLT